MVLGTVALVACSGTNSRAEAARVVRSVEVLRNAANADKAAALRGLEAESCADPAVCELRALCLGAYRHHVRVYARSRELAAKASAPAGVPSAELARIQAELTALRAGLAGARSEAERCAEREAELRQIFKL
jgi:hypothetical protein